MASGSKDHSQGSGVSGDTGGHHDAGGNHASQARGAHRADGHGHGPVIIVSIVLSSDLLPG
jgi:hypothetical protein